MSQEYYRSDQDDPFPERTIFIELKAQHRYFYEGAKDLFEDLNDAVARTIDEVLEGDPDSQLIRKQLAFVSFNYEALANLHEVAHDSGQSDNYRFYWIASTNRCTCFIRKSVPIVTPMVLGQAGEDAWLSGIWFDPAFLVGWGSLLSDINQKRNQSNLQPLELFMSTYNLSKRQFFLRTKLATLFKRPESTQGLIFDLQMN